MERARAESQILQAGIDLIRSHGRTADEIEDYYFKQSNGKVSELMYAKCEELLGVHLNSSHPVPIKAYFHCLLVAVIQERQG